MVSRKKGSNPTDAYRKEQRKKELNKNKANRKKTREHILLNKDTRELEAHLRKAKESDKFNDSTGDRSGQHKAKQLESMYEAILKKKKEASRCSLRATLKI